MKKTIHVFLCTLVLSTIHLNYAGDPRDLSWVPPGAIQEGGDIITPGAEGVSSAARDALGTIAEGVSSTAGDVLGTVAEAAGEGALGTVAEGVSSTAGHIISSVVEAAGEGALGTVAEGVSSTAGETVKNLGFRYHLAGLGGATASGLKSGLTNNRNVQYAIGALMLSYLIKSQAYDRWQTYKLRPLQNILFELATYSNQLTMHNANNASIRQNFNLTLDKLGKIEANNHYAQYIIKNFKLNPNINNLNNIQEIINKYLPPLMQVTARLRGINETSRMPDLNRNDITNLIDAAIIQAKEIQKTYQYTPWAWYRRSQLEQKINTLSGARVLNLGAATDTLRTTVNDLLAWTQ